MKKTILIIVLQIFLARLDLSAQPLTGTKTIKSSGGDYANFTAAINALNTWGVGTGGVVFNVDAGLIFNEDCPAITATGTSANPIKFQKSGSGANPVIKPLGTAATDDAGIKIAGGDYITFDGIDISIRSGSAVEYGYYLYNASATNGAQFNTIKNVRITLNRSNQNSIGIHQYTAVTPTNQLTGNNNNNKYYNFTIENVFQGIYLIGYSTTYYDSNCEIGTTGGGTSTIGASTADDIGVPPWGSGGPYEIYGIQLSKQSGTKVFNVEIRNVTNTYTGYVAGIYVSNVAGNPVSIYNNKIHTIRSSYNNSGLAPYSYVLAIYLSSNTADVNIYNNFIYDLRSGVAPSSAVHLVRAICPNVSGTYNLNYNSVRLQCSANTTSIALAVGMGVTVNAMNNIFSNFSLTDGTSSRFCIYVYGSGTLNNSNYNDLYINTAGTNNYVGYYGANRNTLANWQAATSKDANSINTLPPFVSASDLHLNTSSLGLATPIAITTDIDAESRDATNPDIGADEYNSPLPVELLFFNGKASDDHSVLLNWETASETNSSYWLVEKSSDGRLFTAISNLKAAGNSNQLIKYQYKDNDVSPGLYYYRLKQYDLNGAYCFSNIIAVEVTPNNKDNFIIFPNPATDHLNIAVKQVETPYVLTMSDMKGLVVYKTDFIGSTCVDASKMNEGIYIITITTENELKYIKKILLNKNN